MWAPFLVLCKRVLVCSGGVRLKELKLIRERMCLPKLIDEINPKGDDLTERRLGAHIKGAIKALITIRLAVALR